MKILFINPSVRPDSKQRIPNVGLAYVMSAAERAGFDFQLIDIDAHRYSDAEVESLIGKAQCDVVATGTLVSCYGRMKQLFETVRFHHPRAIIVTGNTLGTSVPEIVLNKTKADICVVGEGDETFVDLIHALDEGRSLSSVPGIAYRDDGKYVRTPERPVIDNIDAIPFPNYDLFDIEVYLKASPYMVCNPGGLPIPFEELVAFPINTARGCPFRCNFCYHAFQEQRYRFRSPASIIAEIKHWKSKYGDELTFFNLAETERFADQMIKEDLGVYWIAACRSELLVRKQGGARVASKLKQAKCHGMGFALESGNPEILAFMNKANTVNEFIEQCHILQEAGIDAYSSIIIGYPQETPATIDDTFRVMTEARVYPSVGFLQLMPGTPMYRMALDQGHIKDEEDYLMRMGDRQDIRINMTKYSDEYLMNYAAEKLRELNQTLKTGVNPDSPIKTGTYFAVAKKDDDRQAESFMEGFGLAAEVVGKNLRESEWTSNPKC